MPSIGKEMFMFIRFCLAVLVLVWAVGMFVMPAGEFAITTIVVAIVGLTFADEAGVNVTRPLGVLMSTTGAARLAFAAGALGSTAALLALFDENKELPLSFRLCWLEKKHGFPLMGLMVAQTGGLLSSGELVTLAYRVGRTFRA